MSRTFIESDVLIDVLRQDAIAVAMLLKLRQHASLAMSVVVRMEIVQGCTSKEALQQATRLLARLEVVQLSEAVSEMADKLVTQFYLSNGLKIADALIAATALVYDVPLLTKNQRDFRFIPGLKLLPYPTA